MSHALSLSTVVNPNPGWYRGDFHAHSSCSHDAHDSPQRLLKIAGANGLDFFTITDHNTIDSFSKFGVLSDTLVIPGIEVTTERGHLNIFGLEEWNSWMAHIVLNGNTLTASVDAHLTMTDLMAKSANLGLLNSINHPYLTPWDWLYSRTDLRHVHCLEIWNDPGLPENEAATPKAVALWTRLLNHGHRITAIGGSDYHRPVPRPGDTRVPEQLGLPATVVYAPQLSGTAILEALQRHRAYVSIGPEVSFQAVADAGTYEIGDDLGENHTTVTLKGAGSTNKTPISSKIVKNGKVIAESKTGTVECIDSVDTSAWYRFEIYNQDGQLLAITNPIFAGAQRTPVQNRYRNFAE